MRVDSCMPTHHPFEGIAYPRVLSVELGRAMHAVEKLDSRCVGAMVVC